MLQLKHFYQIGMKYLLLVYLLGNVRSSVHIGDGATAVVRKITLRKALGGELVTVKEFHKK